MPDSVTPGAVLDSKYRVERILGRGGMGMVVAARHLELGELVAVKFMHAQAMASFDDADVRFRREAQAVAGLHSENIARVIDGGTLPGGAPYIVMEYLDGVDLATVLQEHGPVAVTDTVDWVLQICAAMAEAHGHGIVHRDLKPANLFLTRGPSGMARVKVLDFGISKCQAEGEDALFQTSTIGTMGSPSYMSPEQARSAKLVDARTDIWSIGVILYHLMSGRLPFAAGSTAELFVQILHGAPEPLGEVAPWVPSRLSDMVMRCLAKEPGERCAGVIELGAALAPYASEQGRAWFAASPLADAAMPNGRAWSEPGLTVPLAPTAEPDVFSSIVVEGPPLLELDEFLARVGSLCEGDLTVPHPLSAVSLGITMAGATTTSASLRLRRSTIIGVCSLLVVAIGLALLIGSSRRQRSTSTGTPAAHMEEDSASESKKKTAGEPENHPVTSVDAGVKAGSRPDPGQTAGRDAPDTVPPAAAATSRTRTPAVKSTKSSRKKSSGSSGRRTNSRDRDRDNGQPSPRPGPFDSIQ